MGWKEFLSGEVLNAEDINEYLMRQSTMVFNDTIDRNLNGPSAASLEEGNKSYIKNANRTDVWNGSAWVPDVPTFLTAGTQGYTALSNGTAGISYQPVSHNYIINGAFDIWQRGTSFAGLTGGGQFTADRWSYQASGATTTITQETFTPGDLNVVGFGDAKTYMKLDVTVANDNAGLVYRVEDVTTLAGQEVTLSFWMKSTASSMKTVFYQNFGSGGSATVNVGALFFTPTTSWARYTRTVTLPSISGKTIGAGNYLQIEISNPNNETSTIEIWGVQLEAGSVATPFKRHAPSLQGELAACQRYYYRIEKPLGGRFGTGYNASTSATIFAIFTPVSMRGGAPSTSYANLEVRYAGTSLATVTAASAGSDITGNLYHLTVDVSGTPLTSGAASSLRASASNGVIELSAEL